MADVNLVDLIEQHSGVGLREAARHWQDGPEFWGMCPFCGVGNDRFHCWPQAPVRPHYWCRVCGASGDGIQFLRDYEQMSYVEACQELGLDPDDKSPAPVRKAIGKDAIPGDLWQDRARDLIHTAQKCLWSSKGAQALAYLCQRGFTDETIRAYELGYIPAGDDGLWLEDNPAQWGLLSDDCQNGVVKLPRGILIPWRMSSDVWKLEVRLYPEPKKEGAKKLPSIKGSKDCLYNINAFQTEKPVILCESALDAISGMQACGGQVTFVATGGSKQAQQFIWTEGLKRASCVLVAFDNDESGEEGAQYWLDSLSNAERAYPWAHDINDMLKNGLDICDWLTNELEAYELSHRKPVPAAAPVEVTTEQPRVIKSYRPVSLPDLPRKRCPHTVLTPDGKIHPCKGKPGASGWCEEHAASHDLLCLGAAIGYPAVTLNQYRSICAGVANWEAYAVCAPQRWLDVDMEVIRLRLNYHEAVHA